jgi:hypothetical protein
MRRPSPTGGCRAKNKQSYLSVPAFTAPEENSGTYNALVASFSKRSDFKALGAEIIHVAGPS